MKKIISLVLVLVMCLTTVALLASCSHDHVYSADWSADDTNHWHACTEKDDCEEKADLAAHTFGTPEYKDGKRVKTCTVCAKAVSEDYDAEVDETEWASAFELDAENYTVVSVITEGEESETAYVSLDAGKYHYKSGEGEDLYEYYYAKEEDKYYRYNYNEELQTWRKEEVTEERYNGALSENLSAAFPMESFTYDAESKSYKADSYVVNMGGDVTMSDAVVKFVEGKLIYFTLTQTMETPAGNMEMTITYTITYGNASVTLPTVAAE